MNGPRRVNTCFRGSPKETFGSFPLSSFENRSRTTCSRFVLNHSLCLRKLFSFSNLDGNFGGNQLPDGSICLSPSSLSSSTTTTTSMTTSTHTTQHQQGQNRTSRRTHGDRHRAKAREREKETEKEDREEKRERERHAALVKLASPSSEVLTCVLQSLSNHGKYLYCYTYIHAYIKHVHTHKHFHAHVTHVAYFSWKKRSLGTRTPSVMFQKRSL